MPTLLTRRILLALAHFAADVVLFTRQWKDGPTVRAKSWVVNKYRPFQALRHHHTTDHTRKYKLVKIFEEK